MSKIDKLLDKFNKAKNAINSLKGIASKIQSINYTTAIDELGDLKESAYNQLNNRRQNLKNTLAGGGLDSIHAKKEPGELLPQVVYPYHDKLANYIVFDVRKRANEGTMSKNTDHPVFKERSIALYVPDTLISQANVRYKEESVGDFPRAMLDVLQQNNLTDGFKAGGEQMNTVLTSMAFKGLQGISSGLIGLQKGVAVNPQMEQMLDNIPFRSWDFTFDFYPKSEDEAARVREIIYTFRSSMLPNTGSIKIEDVDLNPFALEEGTGAIIGNKDFSPGTMTILDDMNTQQNAFNYPNIFDIYFAGPLANNIDGFLPAICTNAQVDYTGGQKFSTHYDGMPNHIQLTLNFLEIRIMSLQNYEMIKAPRHTVDTASEVFNKQNQRKNLKNNPYGALLDSSIQDRAAILQGSAGNVDEPPETPTGGGGGPSF